MTIKVDLSCHRGGRYQGCLMLTWAILSGRALDWPLVQTRMHTTSVPSEGAPRQPVTMNPAGCGQLIQLQPPLENV